MKFDESLLYNIKSDYQGIRYSLFDLATWKNGLAFKKIDFSDKGLPVIKIAELNNGISSNTSFTQGDYGEEVFVQWDDLLFSWSGNPQTSIDVFRYRLTDGWLNQHIFKVTANSELVTKDFLYYTLKYLKPYFTQIATNKQTTGLGHVTIADLKRMSVVIPQKEIQEQITSILKAIDDKIEVNSNINENLQQQAQALFKSWFLDYEPWDGTAPNSWLHGKLGDYANIKRGGSPRPIQEYLSDSGLRWLKISDVTGLQTPFIIDIKDHIIEEGLKKTVFLKAGSLVLSNSATPGIPKILDVDSCIHDGWLYFPESKFSNEYLYLYFKYIRQQLVNLSNGSVFNNLKTDILKGYPTILPDEETLQRFDGIIKPMFLQMQNLTRESHDLIDLRDTILPRLMSGELDVSGIQL